jgi:hypothetical protein
MKGFGKKKHIETYRLPRMMNHSNEQCDSDDDKALITIIEKLARSKSELNSFIDSKKDEMQKMSEPDEIIQFHKKTREVLNRGVFFEECEKLDGFVCDLIRNDVQLTFEQQMMIEFNALFTGENDGIIAAVSEWTIFSNKKPTHPDFKGYLDNSLSKAFFSGRRVEAKEYLYLFPKNITSFGKENIKLIFTAFEVVLSKWEAENGTSLIKYFGNKYTNMRSQYIDSIDGKSINGYYFSRMKKLGQVISQLTRDAENLIREERGLPKVGEGWISETRLFYQIKEAFPNHDVIHHARPRFLGNQHLDIFIPKLKVAVEYQGLQHDQPVDYFGGREAFEQQKRRDERKKRLCEQNNVELIYVKEGYDIKFVID